MSYYYKNPKMEFKKVSYKSQEYLYIYQDDPNIENSDDRISWVYIELKDFWMKKQSKVLTLGNHIGIIYSLTGYSESMINEWIREIKTIIGFP